MSRKRFSELEVIDTLLVQGMEITCFRCGVGFTRDDISHDNVEKEHLHEIALGGPDIPENCRFSHYGCHAKITNGTPATTAGSSKHRIAKTRGNRAEKFQVKKLPLDAEREPRIRFGGRR